MAFRGGRGRGRGGFFGGFQRVKEEPFKLYPEDVALPDKKCVALDEDFFRWNNKLQSYFENSAYYVEESASGDNQICDVERFSDMSKPRNKMKRESLSDYMKLQPGYFPLELIQGMKARPQKKVKWDTEQGSKSLDNLFDKLAKKDKEKKEDNQGGDEEGGDEEDSEENEEDYSSGGDYEQNKDFDDDDDDFNDNDDGDDEPFY
ncbi:hypothetical protein V2J09_007792 [Rumex salicifolius]